MNYSTLENLGVKLSKLGFGAMRLPVDANGVINQEAVDEMVAYAMAQGVNYFDTSIVYHNGQSEVALGKALRHFSRDSYYVADKMSFWGVETPEQLDTVFEGSLERLGMAHIDFYLMHAMNYGLFDKMKKLDTINWAIEKQRQGKIKYLGFSIHDDAELLRQLLDVHNWDFVQIQYNYLDEKDRPGKEGYDELVRRGIPIIIMEPLKGGLLATIPDHFKAPLTALNPNVSAASYSFRWLAEKPGIACILSGMNQLPHMIDNINTFKNLSPLTDAEHDAIEQIKLRIQESQKVPCTACKYCLPCPLGIDIPSIFGNWNIHAMNQSGNWISGGDIDYSAVAQCIACGKCIKKCPQHIQIPDKFKELLASR